jgi:hypothetical protein
MREENPVFAPAALPSRTRYEVIAQALDFPGQYAVDNPSACWRLDFVAGCTEDPGFNAVQNLRNHNFKAKLPDSRGRTRRPRGTDIMECSRLIESSVSCVTELVIQHSKTVSRSRSRLRARCVKWTDDIDGGLVVSLSKLDHTCVNVIICSTTGKHGLLILLGAHVLWLAGANIECGTTTSTKHTIGAVPDAFQRGVQSQLCRHLFAP